MRHLLSVDNNDEHLEKGKSMNESTNVYMGNGYERLERNEY